jgi:hypothetical protein
MGHTGKPFSKSLFATFALLNSIWIFYLYLSITSIGTFDPAKFSRLIEGAAEKPYVSRVLIPWLAKSFAFIVPNALTIQFDKAPAAVQKTFFALRATGYDREAVVAILIMFISLFGFAFAQQQFLTALGLGSPLELFFLPLIAQVFVLPFTVFFGYVYDLPHLLLTTLCLTLMLRNNWGMYFGVLVFACLNKETSVLLLVIFAVYFWSRLPRERFFALFSVQVLIYGGVRVMLIYLFRDNPGNAIYLTLQNHYDQYVAYPPAFLITLGFFVLLGLVIARSWSRKHPFLRSGTVMLIALTAGFFLSGMPVEFRVLLDALPIVTALMYVPNPTYPGVSTQIIDKPFPTA